MPSIRPSSEQVPPRPLPGSYWVRPNRLLVGEYPGSRSRADTMERLKQVLSVGVTQFIDLTDPTELPSYESLLPFSTPTGRRIEYQREPIPDHGVPASNDVMARILSALDAALAAGHVVYLHCRAGIGRSAMVAGCYLVEAGMTADQALEELQACWQQSSRSLDWVCIPETDDQYEYIRGWARRRGRVAAPAAPAVDRPSPLHQRVRGALLGLAAGDVLGAARAGRDDGEWTQHTALALCTAESLLAKRNFDPKDQMERFLRWKREGNRGDRQPMPVSEDVSRALATYRWRGLATAGSHDPRDRSGGSLTRAIPAALYSLGKPSAALMLAAECSRTTHQGPVVLDACRYYAAMLVGALRGAGVAVTGNRYEPVAGLWSRRPLKREVDEIVSAAPLAEAPPKKPVQADVLKTLSNVRRVLMVSTDFEIIVTEATRAAIDPALDGALSGALAGAVLGANAIPAEMLAKLPRIGVLEDLATQFSALHHVSRPVVPKVQ